ncbi:hypothetical protein ACH3XW_28080 [Acanthocheilonema viteae]
MHAQRIINIRNIWYAWFTGLRKKAICPELQRFKHEGMKEWKFRLNRMNWNEYRKISLAQHEQLKKVISL